MLALTAALRDRQRCSGRPAPSAGGKVGADGWEGGGGGGTGGGASDAGGAWGRGPLPESGPGGGPEGCPEEDRELMTFAP
ncbi:hypothetical protein [Streptomyces sp. NPDC058874]|uniref:hypothetical protein n=1 Tax=unclassified Streptomyces TaxID=2593676 RepID=UPI003679EE0E